ncbi:MAG TPA: hypothetical protein PLW99_03340, partial [Candidatus Paceibacterota bacterium]|nr:hypothetical protein [Candidatus Paceibacterota bacterium]
EPGISSVIEPSSARPTVLPEGSLSWRAATLSDRLSDSGVVEAGGVIDEWRKKMSFLVSDVGDGWLDVMYGVSVLLFLMIFFMKSSSEGISKRSR